MSYEKYLDLCSVDPNLDVVRIYDEQKALPPHNSPENKRLLYEWQGGLCHGCGEPFRIQRFEVDHYIPKAHGGSDQIKNLQLLCRPCNRKKGVRRMKRFLLMRDQQRRR